MKSTSKSKSKPARSAPKAARAVGARKAPKKSAASRSKPTNVVLLSGDNPQIAKGDGDAPVQAYLAAIPGWKQDIARRLDTIIERTVPNVQKAVKWNTPFYGVEGQGWFIAFHMFAKYVKVTFFKGTSLQPVPPDPSKHPEVRYVNIHEGTLDEKQLTSWVKQAAALPGWIT